ncbi:unannotated protein [freshwater metagenome]|uniref:Unannotated protein n=1 Tax=freshwater metagenome TaxID=449393 RepID=A0A6J7ESH1_9ZZZZ
MAEPRAPLDVRDVESDDSSLDWLHPRPPGRATVSEMVRAFWPFTRGSRRVLGLQLAVSLLLFALLGILPLLTGDLLRTALNTFDVGDKAHQYVENWLALQSENPAILSTIDLSSADRESVLVGIRASAASALETSSTGLLDALFVDGRTYRTAGSLGKAIALHAGEVEDSYGPVVNAVIADGRIGRAELDELRVPKTGAVAMDRTNGFDYLVSVLALHPAASNQRSDARISSFTGELLRFAGVVVAAVMLRAIAVGLAINATSASARRLQDAVFERVHDTALVEAGALGRPSMLSRCTTYVDQVQEALLKAQTDGVLAFASLLLSLSLVLWIDVPIGMMLIGAVLIFEFIRRIVSSRWTALAHQRLDFKTVLSETTDAAVSTVASVRAIRAEEQFRRRFRHEADEVRSWTTRLQRFGEAFGLTAFAIGQVGVLIVISVVGFLRSDLSIGEATAAVLYVRAVAEAMSSLPTVLIHLHEAAPYMRRLRRVLLAPVRRAEPADPVLLPTRPGALHAENMGYSEPDGSGGCVDVSFTATALRWTMLVGPVGSGYESIGAVAAGLERPDTGRVLLDDVDLASASLGDVCGHVAVLPANSVVLEATLAENLTVLRPQATVEEIDRAVVAAGLTDLVARLPNGTSSPVGGRRRPVGPQDRARIGLARVLISHAEVVIISDPTVGLDLEAGEDFWASARRHLDGRIVIASTPRLDMIDARDQVLVLEHGAVVDVGTRAELLARQGVFTRLWQRMLDGVDPAGDLGSIPGLARLSPEVLAQLGERLVTERFEDGQTIIATGEAADRVFIVVDGMVELFEGDRRVATVKTGNHFGDIEAAGGAPTALSAIARGATVLRSLHRLAISGGVANVLDRSPAERALYAHLARNGVSTAAELEALGHRTDLGSTLAGLVADGVVVQSELGGEVTYRLAGSQRRRRGGAVSLLDTL